MAYTEASKRATMKYIKENYDVIRIKVKKGKREEIKAYAESKYMSMNEYFKWLLRNDGFDI